MVEQYDGRVKRRPRAPAKFRDFAKPIVEPSNSTREEGSEEAVNEDDSDWLEEVVATNQSVAGPSDTSVDSIANQLSALRLFNLQSPALLCMLSNSPVPTVATNQPITDGNTNGNGKGKGKGKELAPITAADDIDWD
jgi:hypothetical protein